MSEEALPFTHKQLSGHVGASSVQAGRIKGGVHIRHNAAEPRQPPPVPHQVPAVSGPFENRVRELASLHQLLLQDGANAGSVRIAVLSGLPGVGKRTTAHRWVEEVGRHFPGGELYIDYSALRKGDQSADITEAVAGCLRGLGVEEDFLPPRPEDQFNLLRTKTSDRPVLFVINDVMDPDEVSRLLPKAPGSVVLATGSPVLAARPSGVGDLSGLEKLVSDGARWLPLHPLDATCGIRLLDEMSRSPDSSRVAAEPAAARRLVELCGHLPMALRIVGARLATHEELTLSAVCEELEDEGRRLAALSGSGEGQMSAVLSMTYGQLSQGTAALYRRLGLLPAHTFDLATAALVADTLPSTAERRLAELKLPGLLDGTNGRYRLHDLVRLHARERATEEEEPGAERALVVRVLGHRLRMTASADRALREDRLRIVDLGVLLDDDAPDPFAQLPGDEPGARAGRALDWLVAERANTLALLRAGFRYGLYEQVRRLAEVQCVLYLHQRHVTEWVECAQTGADAAARVGAKAAEARLRSLLSRPLMDLGQYDGAREALERAVELADKTEHLALKASVQEFLGRYWDRFDKQRALATYRNALALNNEADEPRGAAVTRCFMGDTQYSCRDYNGALATLGDARVALLGFAEPDQRMAARALFTMGKAWDALGDQAAAWEAFSRARETLHALRASRYEADALEGLAELAGRTGDRAAVREYLGSALEIHEAGGSPRAEELRARLGEVG